MDTNTFDEAKRTTTDIMMQILFEDARLAEFLKALKSKRERSQVCCKVKEALKFFTNFISRHGCVCKKQKFWMKNHNDSMTWKSFNSH